MNARLFSIAGGVFVAAVLAVAAAADSRGAAAQAAAGQPRFINARVEAREAGAPLAQSVPALVRAQPGSAWIGYTVPAVPGDHRSCESNQPRRVYLEGRPRGFDRVETPAASHEPAGEVAILLRAEASRVRKVRVFSLDCELDAGGLPVIWLSGVRGADSVAMLRGLLANPDTVASDLRQDPIVMAIALHGDPAAQRALEDLAGPDQPAAIRKRAAFWLGAARGGEGFQALRRMAAAEKDETFRRELVFPISLSRLPEATDVLIQLAKSDASAAVRKQAMFWLGQRAGRAAASTLGDAAANDPDTEVKKRAVFGLSRMANGEGVPRLIEVARGNSNPEVRRQAMFWLGQSNDPRALAFLEEFLRKQPAP